jgi:gamma-glutamyltranspeptidase/glutathione hydrolase
VLFRNILSVVCGAVLLAACAQVPRIELRLGAGDRPQRYAAFAMGDEPQAVRIAQRMLEARGSAADAATALALGLAVTLPSVAGLGGGGVCLVHKPDEKFVRALHMTRLLPGLRVMQSTYGRLPWQQLVAPAENLARFGHPVSQALATHLREAGAVIDDGTTLAAFMNARRQILQAGETLTQPALAETLSLARTRAGTARDIPKWRDGAPPQQAAQITTAATGFIVGDDTGAVVACVLTLGRLFGTGKMQAGEGYLQSDSDAVRAAVLDVAVMLDPTSGRMTSARAGGGFTNTLDCASQDELGTQTCIARTDARGTGLAVMLSEDRS